MKTRNLFWLSAALLMAACTNEEDISMASSSAIRFNAAISESRVSDGGWDVGDQVGISMKVGDAIPEGCGNKLYTVQSANGAFQTTGTALRFPDDPQSDVTFYAYYPYSGTLDGNKLTFDVDGKTDVLWASEEVTIDEQASNKVQLGFYHALSKVILETSGFPDDIEVTLSEGYSQATMDITTGEVVGTATAEEGNTVELLKGSDGNFSAIVLPVSDVEKTLTVVSVSADRQWTYTIASATYEGGYQYAYKATYSNAEGTQFVQDGITGWQGETS